MFLPARLLTIEPTLHRAYQDTAVYLYYVPSLKDFRSLILPLSRFQLDLFRLRLFSFQITSYIIL